MTLRQLTNQLTRLVARPDVDLDAPVWIEGDEDEDLADQAIFLPDSQRVYIMRRRNGPGPLGSPLPPKPEEVGMDCALAEDEWEVSDSEITILEDNA